MSKAYDIPFEDKLKCSICGERLKDARSLPCGHTYCKGCLEKEMAAGRQRGHGKCLDCNEPFQVPDGGAEGLPRSFVINGFLDEINKAFPPGTSQVSIGTHGFQSAKIFECSICLQPFDDARYLPCGHSFCRKCLDVVSEQHRAASRSNQHDQGRIKCGECREEHDLPTGGVARLPTCFRINSIAKVIRANTMDDEDDCNGRSQQQHHAAGPTPGAFRQATPTTSGHQRPARRSAGPTEDVHEAKLRAREASTRMQVLVKQTSGKTVTIDCNPTDTIEALKKKLSTKINYDGTQQRLVFNGKNLDDNSRTLQSYGIRNHATIQVAITLKGG